MSGFSEGVRVLHVDDEPDFAEVAGTFLEQEDERFDVETAPDATAALERLAEGNFDCVVSDYDMPGRNGIELLESVREDYPKLPFVLYTGKGSEAVASDAISAGVTDYLQKDSGTSQYAVLANRIRNAVENYRTRTELADREQRLNLFFEQSPLGVIEWNENFDFVRMNDAAEEILGYTEAELTGRSWEEIVPESDREPVDDIVSDLLEDEGGYYSVNENVRKDGDRIACEWHNRVVTDEHGDVVAVFSQFRDITERKTQERELERIKEFFSEAERLGQLGAWEFGTDGELIWTAGTRRIHGVDEEFEPTVEKAVEFYHPGDRAAIEQAVERALEAGEQYDIEARLLTANDETRWIRTRGIPVDGGERVRGYIQDITEEKERENEDKATIAFLQSLYDIATNPELSPDEKISHLLETGPEKLGLPYGHLTRIERSEDDPRDGTQTVIEASGNHDLLQPGASCPLARSYCRKTIGRNGLLEIQNPITAGWEDDPAYETFGLECYIGTPVTVNDELYGTVFFASDTPRAEPFTDAERTFVRLMSQLVSYELERKQATNDLKRQNERLEQFASVVSHDLRNPLNVADGHLELARAERDSDHIDAVATAHDRMEALIDDLLALAREGEEVTDPEPVELADLLESCWRNVDTAETTLVADTGHTVRADRSRLAQLLENLIRNAVEHGGDDVTITVGETDDGFYVADDGAGIPAAERERVFDSGYSTVDDGTGFGLAIVREITEAHGWEISVTDSAAGGARFDITGVEFPTE